MSRPIKKFEPGKNMQPLLLALVEYDDEPGVTLAVVGDNGKEHNCGCIATISERGMELIAGLNPELGLPLDERGRIKLADPKHASAVGNLTKRSEARKELAKLLARIGPTVKRCKWSKSIVVAEAEGGGAVSFGEFQRLVVLLL